MTIAAPRRLMPNRRLLLAIVGAFGALLLWTAGRGLDPPAFPDLDRNRIARIDLRRGIERLSLAHGDDGWVIVSAANAPADSTRVSALIDGLASVRVSARKPSGRLRVTAVDRDGQPVIDAWLIEKGDLARLSLKPGDWTSIGLPDLDPASVVRIEMIAPGDKLRCDRPDADRPFTCNGAAADDVGLRALAALPGRLSLVGLTDGQAINWAGARYIQLTTADGLTVALQVARGADGIAWVRLNADGLRRDYVRIARRAAAIKALRRYAFRLDPAHAVQVMRATESFMR